MNIKFNRTDMAKINNKNTHIIKFNHLNNSIKDKLKNEINLYLNNISHKKSALIVGLGNSEFTADSIGPLTIKNIKTNGFIKNLGFKNNQINIYTIIPGVLSKTGIDTGKIIKAITKEIKPDFLIVIDSFITDNINLLEKSIEINDKGIIPGSGIFKVNTKINKTNMNVPVIVIGVPTALEINIHNKDFIVTSTNIDKYIVDISIIISDSLNEIFYK